MRILHVISGLPKAAGTSVFCVEVCERLLLLGLECCVGVKKKRADDYALGRTLAVV